MDPCATPEPPHATLYARVHAYVGLHVRDPELSPGRIAAANGISERMLYKLYEARGRSLEQVVIEQRLEGARADLTSPTAQHRTIAAVALSWGFTSPSFFSSRFHLAYGMTPREWRARHSQRVPAAH